MKNINKDDFIVDRDRTRELLDVLSDGHFIKHFVSNNQHFSDQDLMHVNIEDFNTTLSCMLELILDHLPRYIERVNKFEEVYSSWWEKIQLFDKLAVAVINKNKKDRNKCLKKLGYKKL